MTTEEKQLRSRYRQQLDDIKERYNKLNEDTDINESIAVDKYSELERLTNLFYEISSKLKSLDELSSNSGKNILHG